MSLNRAMQDQHRAMIEKIDETEALLNAQVSKKFNDLRMDIDKMFGFDVPVSMGIDPGKDSDLSHITMKAESEVLGATS